MSKRHKKAEPVMAKSKEKKMTINVNKIYLANQPYKSPIKSGWYMTEKDRPRKKDWKRADIKDDY